MAQIGCSLKARASQGFRVWGSSRGRSRSSSSSSNVVDDDEDHYDDNRIVMGDSKCCFDRTNVLDTATVVEDRRFHNRTEKHPCCSMLVVVPKFRSQKSLPLQTASGRYW